MLTNTTTFNIHVQIMPIKPKFGDAQSWDLANLLMQPALIRTIDNIRKQLETSTWKGVYHEYPIWPDDVSEATRGKISLLQQELKTAPPQQVDDIEDALAQLPVPMQAYELHLAKGDRTVILHVWDLCYQICFANADRVALGENVEVDLSLLEDDSVEVDWTQLEAKTKAVIEPIFAGLD
jgi:hypothetical protein